MRPRVSADRSAMSAQPLVPPPNPYGSARRRRRAAATLPQRVGAVRRSARGAEVRVGRDPAQCSIFLAEPRVSGVHATLRFESGQLARARRDVEQRDVGGGRAHPPGRLDAGARGDAAPLRPRRVRRAARRRDGRTLEGGMVPWPRARPAAPGDRVRDSGPTPDAIPTSRSTRTRAATARRASGTSASSATAWAGTPAGARRRSSRSRRSSRCSTRRRRTSAPGERAARPRSRRRAAACTRCTTSEVALRAARDRRSSRVLMHASGTEVAHVGDSRAYLVHAGADHPRDARPLDRPGARRSRAPHAAAGGAASGREPDHARARHGARRSRSKLRPQPVHHVAGDAFMLCSDGLSDLVEDDEILAIVRQRAGAPRPSASSSTWRTRAEVTTTSP